MGHYASEMSSTWMSQSERDREQANKAGFKYNSLYQGGSSRYYDCPRCAAIVQNWKKHKEVCGK